jgi:hypothetical protein
MQRDVKKQRDNVSTFIISFILPARRDSSRLLDYNCSFIPGQWVQARFLPQKALRPNRILAGHPVHSTCPISKAVFQKKQTWTIGPTRPSFSNGPVTLKNLQEAPGGEPGNSRKDACHNSLQTIQLQLTGST